MIMDEQTIAPNAMDIKVGKLTIRQEPNETGCVRTGIGTRVWLDGKEFWGIRKLVLTIGCDYVTTAEISTFVDWPNRNEVKIEDDE